MNYLLVCVPWMAMACAAEAAPSPEEVAPGPRSTPELQREVVTTLRTAVRPLLDYRHRSGSSRFDGPIEALIELGCRREGQRFRCEEIRHEFAEPVQPSFASAGATPLLWAVALRLGGYERTRTIAAQLACSLCAEQAMACLCDQHPCRATEILPPSGPGLPATLVCGALIVDGVTIPWGAAVEQIDNLLWGPSPLARRGRGK